MKKLIAIAVLTFTILTTNPAAAINTQTTGQYLWNCQDGYHMIMIQGQYYAVETSIETLKAGDFVVVNIELSDNDTVKSFTIIK